MAYSGYSWIRPLCVVETGLFLRQAEDVWADQEREVFVDYIARNPEAGDIVPGTGGVRKIRWRRTGSGKRGGVRVIYFYQDVEAPLYLLMIYAKGRQGNLSADEKKMAYSITMGLKQSRRNRGDRN
jgi:hypothetical protein